jgi:hypothetical protein
VFEKGRPKHTIDGEIVYIVFPKSCLLIGHIDKERHAVPTNTGIMSLG